MYHVYIIICEQVAIWENMVSVYIKLHGISLHSVILIASQNMYGSYILYGDVRFMYVLRYTMPISIVVGIFSVVFLYYTLQKYGLFV